MADPVIRVGFPTWKRGDGVVEMVVGEMVVLECSSCGELDDARVTFERTAGRQALQTEARLHGNEVHDGLAVNVGWSW